MMEHGRGWLHPKLGDDIRKDVLEWRRRQLQSYTDEAVADRMLKDSLIAEAESIIKHGN